MPFPESQNYITLAGLILEYAETIPDENQELEIPPYRIKILHMLQNSPDLIEAVLMPQAESNQEENE